MIYKLELTRKACRVKEAKALYNVTITSSAEMSDLARRLLKDEAQEIFLAFYLDAANVIIGYVEISRGGLAQCIVDPKVVFSAALLVGAISILVVHNHPSSGKTDPSKEDETLTIRLSDGATLLGMTLLDHLIIGRKTCISMAEKGLKGQSCVS